jgi:hypothetical protein
MEKDMFAAVLADVNSIHYELATEHSDEASCASYREIDAQKIRVIAGKEHKDAVQRVAYELIHPCDRRGKISGRDHYSEILVSRSNLVFGETKVGRNWMQFNSLSQTTYRRYEIMDTHEYKWTRHIKCSVEPFCSVHASIEIGCSDLYNPLSVGARIEYRHVLAGVLQMRWTPMEEIIAASDALKAKRKARLDNGDSEDSEDSD